MIRKKIKWKVAIYLILTLSSTNSLPIQPKADYPKEILEASYFKQLAELNGTEEFNGITEDQSTEPFDTVNVRNKNKSNFKNLSVAANESVTRQNLRPGQDIRSYDVELNINGNSFNGRTLLDVGLSQDTREDPIVLYALNLDIHSVRVGIITDENAVDTPFATDGFILEIFPNIPASSYIVIIEYSGLVDFGGSGLYMSDYGTDTYLGMNLHPLHARRVFPCIDEPTELSIISFTVNHAGYNNLVANSILEDGSQNQFRALQGPPHLWGLMAHNFRPFGASTPNVILYGREGIVSQDFQANQAINSYFNNLNEWTNKDYFEIMVDQDGRMNVIALPDVSSNWHSLSIVGIWEPYILMELTNAVKQRKIGLAKIAEAMARQWFGYVIFPENWRYEWVVSGLATYAGYEMFRLFQQDILTDITQLDVNTLFVTDVIQESLLYDAYSSATVLEPDRDLFEEDEILDHLLSNIMKYKAPALMRMWRLVLGDAGHDIIQAAGRALLAGRSLQTVNSLNFIDALNSDWMVNGNGMVDDIAEYLEPWILNNGYPLLHVGLRQGGVLITQERFGFSGQSQVNYLIPVTFTTSINPNFSEDNISPVMMMDGTTTLNMALDEDDWVLFNIQGQGYYRVNYDGDLWERILEALQDPQQRERIHPLNRATLVDDALNLARAGRLDYEIAFEVVLSMEHETEYAVWKAFVRNMSFLQKRLEALIFDDEDLDPDIYLRMVRRTVGSIENELGFYPDISLSEPAMTTLTRGLVMEHACKANYQPCIAAAVDWFYNPDSNEPQVNPNIPREIRPAVYCTMVREGDDQVISALYERLEIEPTQYERLVILESLACSRDDNFIRTLLEETVAVNSPYLVEERAKIFTAVAESSYQNAGIAMNFMSRRTIEIRNRYGGSEKLEELIYVLVENMADADLSQDFNIWATSNNNNLEESQLTAERALEQVNENLQWDAAHMDYVYEWIDENHASAAVLSALALCVSLLVTFLNH